MTDYKLYPNLPSPPPENPQVAYCLSIIRAKMQGLKNKEQMFMFPLEYLVLQHLLHLLGFL